MTKLKATGLTKYNNTKTDYNTKHSFNCPFPGQPGGNRAPGSKPFWVLRHKIMRINK